MISGSGPRAHYCPKGSAVALPCPSGRFRNTTGAVNELLCEVCPPGGATVGLNQRRASFSTVLCFPARLVGHPFMLRRRMHLRCLVCHWLNDPKVVLARKLCPLARGDRVPLVWVGHVRVAAQFHELQFMPCWFNLSGGLIGTPAMREWHVWRRNRPLRAVPVSTLPSRVACDIRTPDRQPANPNINLPPPPPCPSHPTQVLVFKRVTCTLLSR